VPVVVVHASGKPTERVRLTMELRSPAVSPP
jgi:hypothetical protein